MHIFRGMLKLLLLSSRTFDRWLYFFLFGEHHEQIGFGMYDEKKTGNFFSNGHLEFFGPNQMYLLPF